VGSHGFGKSAGGGLSRCRGKKPLRPVESCGKYGLNMEKKHGQTIEKMRGKYKESFTDPNKLA
jgi:hypothetical protein